ncbi:hypothetical protein OUZ56_020052 [Daphnia magna]|uniref:Uncharacterized protein n=1 Tax=Daphnia magna TaxID=35525 RepID=A0ABQ9ZDG0_9CRUS|nr:hypothetical protein OUZ56_020052 [Daphnia magna]
MLPNIVKTLPSSSSELISIPTYPDIRECNAKCCEQKRVLICLVVQRWLSCLKGQPCKPRVCVPSIRKRTMPRPFVLHATKVKKVHASTSTLADNLERFDWEESNSRPCMMRRRTSFEPFDIDNVPSQALSGYENDEETSDNGRTLQPDSKRTSCIPISHQ